MDGSVPDGRYDVGLDGPISEVLHFYPFLQARTENGCGVELAYLHGLMV